VLRKLLHCAHETAAQEVFAYVQALQLAHRFYLLFTACARIHQRVILLLNPTNLSLDLLLPVIVNHFLSLLVLVFEFADFVQFGVFFHLEDSLFARFAQQYVQNGLHFHVEVKQVVVANFGELINACLFGDVAW